mmetsp:Transcript_37390/g.47673  ORF Transcript_37390/g.47673 Transcript_37390/m.47673 type:complete len:91 (-) Transcript_37390:874-1146(-)
MTLQWNEKLLLKIMRLKKFYNVQIISGRINTIHVFQADFLAGYSGSFPFFSQIDRLREDATRTQRFVGKIKPPATLLTFQNCTVLAIRYP